MRRVWATLALTAVLGFAAPSLDSCGGGKDLSNQSGNVVISKYMKDGKRYLHLSDGRRVRVDKDTYHWCNEGDTWGNWVGCTGQRITWE